MLTYRQSGPLIVHIRVVGALVLREIHTRFGDFRAGYLWAIVEPMVHIIAFGVLISFLNHSTPLGNSLEVFIATGVMTFFLFRDVYQRVEGASRSHRALLYFPVVKAIDTVVARIILECATWFLISLTLIALFAAAGIDARPNDPLKVLSALGATAWLAGGFGMVNSVIGEFIQAWEKIINVLMRPVYLASGIMFLPSTVPDPIRDFVSYLPTAHCIDWMRTGFYEGYESDFANKPLIFVIGLVLWCIGLFLERMLRSRMEVG